MSGAVLMSCNVLDCSSIIPRMSCSCSLPCAVSGRGGIESVPESIIDHILLPSYVARPSLVLIVAGEGKK